MSSFQSAPLPLVTRLFANPVLHITVISFLVVAGTLYIIRQQQKQEIARRMEYLRGGPVFKDTSRTQEVAASETSAQPEVDSSLDVPPPPPPPPSPSSATAMAEEANAAVGQGTTRAQGFLPSHRNMATINEPQDRSRNQQNRELKVKVQYLLAPRNTVQRLAHEAQNQPGYLEFGDLRVGVIKNSAHNLTGVDTLETVDKVVEVEGNELIWFVGEKPAETGAGMTAKLAILSRDNQGIRGEIELRNSFFESRDRSAGHSIRGVGPVQFEVPPKSSLFLTMNLPTFAQSETATTGFMRLFQMTNFLQRQSEFVMMIDFD